jgi:transposase
VITEAQIEGTHPATELFPLMSDQELDELAADLKARGLVNDVLTWRDEQGRLLVLDGRNRVIAARKAGVTLTFTEYKGSDPVGMVFALNIQRRNLTRVQKKKLIAALLKMDPSRSDRSIERITQSGHSSVSPIRKEMEEAGEIEPAPLRRDPSSGAVVLPVSRPPSASDEQIATIRRLSWQGLNNVQIAYEVGLSEWTVRKYLKDLRRSEGRDALVGQSRPADETEEPPAVPAPLQPSPSIPVVPKPARGPAAAQERWAKVVELAGEGYSTRQIAKTVGMGEDRIRRLARERNLEIRGDKFVDKTRRPDSNHILQTAVLSAENFTAGLEHVDYNELDKAIIPDWIQSLRKARTELSRVINKLEEHR